MSIVVEGYSGCGIRVLKDETAKDSPRWILEKTSSSASYVPRLHKQIDKQAQFKKLVESLGKRIIVPEVLYRRSVTVEGENGGAPVVQSVTVGMAFEHHTDCITFLGKASQPRIEAFLEQLLDVFQINVEASPISELPATIFTEKLVDVKRVCLKNAVLAEHLPEIDTMVDKLLALFSSQATHSMPLGRCHGDLTLSNLLVQEHHGDRLVLIDFLDSFVETPLADMAKICQDLYYGWTLRQQTRGYDRTRLFTIFRLFRDRLFALYSAHPWFKAYFRPMLLINQMRVLQYSKNPEDALYLLETCRHQYTLWQKDIPSPVA